MRQETIAVLASTPCYVAGAQDVTPFSSGATPEEAGAEEAALPRDLATATPYGQTQERRRLGGILGTYAGYRPPAIAGDVSAERRPL